MNISQHIFGYLGQKIEGYYSSTGEYNTGSGYLTSILTTDVDSKDPGKTYPIAGYFPAKQNVSDDSERNIGVVNKFLSVGYRGNNYVKGRVWYGNATTAQQSILTGYQPKAVQTAQYDSLRAYTHTIDKSNWYERDYGWTLFFWNEKEL